MTSADENAYGMDTEDLDLSQSQSIRQVMSRPSQQQNSSSPSNTESSTFQPNGKRKIFFKLHDWLTQGKIDCIKWRDNGNGFCEYDSKAFEKAWKSDHGSYDSLTRTMKQAGFKKTSTDTCNVWIQADGYFHRDHRTLINKIVYACSEKAKAKKNQENAAKRLKTVDVAEEACSVGATQVNVEEINRRISMLELQQNTMTLMVHDIHSRIQKIEKLIDDKSKQTVSLMQHPVVSPSSNTEQNVLKRKLDAVEI